MLVIWLPIIEYHSVGSIDKAIRSIGWRRWRNALTRTTFRSLLFLHRRSQIIRLTCLHAVSFPSLCGSSGRLLLRLIPIVVHYHCASTAQSWGSALRRSLGSEGAAQVVRKRSLGSRLTRRRLWRCSLRLLLLLHHLRRLCLDRRRWASRRHVMIENGAGPRTNITYAKSNQKINISRKVENGLNGFSSERWPSRTTER